MEIIEEVCFMLTLVLRRNLFLCRRTVCSGGTAPTSASSSSRWWSGRDGSNNNFAILVVTNTPRPSVGTTYDQSVWEEVWTSDSWQSITVQSGHSRGQPLPRQNICSFLKWTIFLSTLFREQTSSIFCVKDERILMFRLYQTINQIKYNLKEKPCLGREEKRPAEYSDSNAGLAAWSRDMSARPRSVRHTFYCCPNILNAI